MVSSSGVFDSRWVGAVVMIVLCQQWFTFARLGMNKSPPDNIGAQINAAMHPEIQLTGKTSHSHQTESQVSQKSTWITSEGSNERKRIKEAGMGQNLQSNFKPLQNASTNPLQNHSKPMENRYGFSRSKGEGRGKHEEMKNKLGKPSSKRRTSEAMLDPAAHIIKSVPSAVHPSGVSLLMQQPEPGKEKPKKQKLIPISTKAVLGADNVAKRPQDKMLVWYIVGGLLFAGMGMFCMIRTSRFYVDATDSDDEGNAQRPQMMQQPMQPMMMQQQPVMQPYPGTQPYPVIQPGMQPIMQPGMQPGMQAGYGQQW
eukprot:gnl/MRDRNA2_/MRDRNA2_137948_c0_seq1.p1 gnl/MRDRNA2_/MRDRNA2_137948_c0~~gnl/MRDRNA2_/MRDRNA2_137948_c0_seq1.p1  ORF type:complete len:312 (+),score=56.50 gnl/MRDRNA2_/MRDRNA2_137948_c0_seq1:104-1039(+)